MWQQVADTRTGRLLLVRLALVVALGVVLWLAARRPSVRSTTWWQALAVAVSLGMVLSVPSAGHASAQTPRSLWVLIDGVHLGGVAVWLGGLLLLATGGSIWFTSPDGERTVRRFSAIATLAVPLIVVTGSLQTLELAGGIDDLTDTSWGRTLLVKLSIVSVLVAIGGVSRWLLRNVSVESLRRSVLAEAALGVVVLGVAASLVSLPPRPIDQGEIFSASLAQAGVLVDITLTPGRVGDNEVHLVITPPGGSLTPTTGRDRADGAAEPADPRIARVAGTGRGQPLHGVDHAAVQRRLDDGCRGRGHTGQRRAVHDHGPHSLTRPRFAQHCCSIDNGLLNRLTTATSAL